MEGGDGGGSVFVDANPITLKSYARDVHWACARARVLVLARATMYAKKDAKPRPHSSLLEKALKEAFANAVASAEVRTHTVVSHAHIGGAQNERNAKVVAEIMKHKWFKALLEGSPTKEATLDPWLLVSWAFGKEATDVFQTLMHLENDQNKVKKAPAEQKTAQKSALEALTTHITAARDALETLLDDDDGVNYPDDEIEFSDGDFD